MRARKAFYLTNIKVIVMVVDYHSVRKRPVTGEYESITGITSHSEEDSRHLGKILGTHINVPLVIALRGELGAGKTCFTQGIAQGLGISNEYYITSPSYALVNTYPGRLVLNHLDLYRLKETTDFEDIGLDEILTSESVCVIEWADRLGSELPTQYIDIYIDIIDEESRRFLFNPVGDTAKKVMRGFLKNGRQLQ